MAMNSDSKIYLTARLFRKSYGIYKWQILLLAVLGIAGGLLEGVGVNAFIPLLSFVTAGRDTSPDNSILNFIKSAFSLFSVPFTLKFLLIFVCLLFIFKAVVSLVVRYISIRIVSEYEEKTRANLLEKTLGASWPHLLRQKIGYLETILMMDIKKSSLLLEQIAGGISNAGNLLIYLAVAFNISSRLTLVTLGLGAVLVFLLKPLIDKTRLVSRQITATNKDVAHFVNENIIGAKTIKSLSVEEAINAEGLGFFKKLKKLQIRSYMLKSFASSFSQPVSIIFISFIFALFYKRPDFNFATLAAVVYLIQRIFLYVNLLQSSLQGVYENLPYLVAVSTYEDNALKNKEERKGAHKFIFEKNLIFNDVSFSYGQKVPILQGINFIINKAEMVGLVGASGSGKTTVVDLLLRLFKPSEGKILLDGRDIWEIDIGEWRKHIGYVSQDIFLKNDTFEKNIRFYNPDIGEKEMVEAAKMANIYDFIEGSAAKFETMVGERGVLMSGGQRQRVALARILAREPQFLILDEATSSLDAESEALIQNAINGLKGKVTILVIAHRLPTVMSCDRLLVLDGGKIAEEGSPEELLNNSESRFHKMHNFKP